MTRLASIALLALLLAGCASRGGPASIAGGECRIFEAPAYEVRGKRAYDQDWIDSQVEGGVGGCRWNRPAPRPASIDAGPPAKAAAAPAKRRGIIARIRDRVRPANAEAPAAAAPPLEPPPAPPVVAPAPAPRPPRSAIERLLEPRDDD